MTSADVRITNISQSLPHKMAETADMKKLRHCHPIMYTLRDLMTITFDLLNLAGDHTRGHVIFPPPSLPSLKILYSCSKFVLKRDVKLPLTQLCSCVLEYIASSILLLLTARLRPLHMRRTRHHLCRGNIFPHMWNPWPRLFYSLCNLCGSTIKTYRVIRQATIRQCIAVCACIPTCVFE